MIMVVVGYNSSSVSVDDNADDRARRAASSEGDRRQREDCDDDVLSLRGFGFDGVCDDAISEQDGGEDRS